MAEGGLRADTRADGGARIPRRRWRTVAGTSASQLDGRNAGGYLFVSGRVVGTGGGASTNTSVRRIVRNTDVVLAGIPGYSYRVKYSSDA